MKKSTVALIGILVHLAVSANGAVINYHSFDSDFKDGVGSNDLTVGGTSVAAPTISNTVGDSVFGSGAANFSTTDDWLATTTAITFSSTDAWSVSFWAARDAASDANQGMVIGDVTDTRDFIWLNENASQGNGFRFRSASNANTNIATTPFDHGFHHWVLVADGTGSLKVYRDNAIVSTSSTNTSFDINAVGRAYTSSAYSMYGQIDELYIYDEAISATKVGQLFIDNTGPDETPPTLDGGSDIADNRAGGPVTANSLVTYAVTFSEDMDDTTVDASDFGNAGTAPVEFGAVVETAPGVFSVPLTPTSTGTLQLQVNQSAVLSDPAGNDLGTSSAILDDTSITVESTDTTAPGITGSEMVDNQSGSPVIVDSLITYTLTFSEGINASTVDASDFGNAGTATVEFGAVVETAPGVFSVEVTPTSAGTLQLQILASAVITDLTGNPLDTSSAILADGIITVEAGFNPSAVERVRVFLVGGQSNADGRAAPSGLPTSPVNLQLPQEDVDFYEGSLMTLRPVGSQFGPEVTLGRCLADSVVDGITTRVALIKYASGGTNLHTQWKGGGDSSTTGDGSMYVSFQSSVTAGLAALTMEYPNAVIEIEGMLWVQGESDANNATNASAYEDNLTAFIADVRLTYGAELLFIISRLASNQTAINATSLATIRAAQDAVAVAESLTGLVDTDGFGMKGDNLHFDAVGQQQIGKAAATELLGFYPFTNPLAIAELENGNLKIIVVGAFPGFLYTLQSNTTLQVDDWADVETKTAEGQLLEFTHTPGVENDKRFFRVVRAASH